MMARVAIAVVTDLAARPITGPACA